MTRLDKIRARLAAATPGPWRVPTANVFRIVHPKVVDGTETRDWVHVALCDVERRETAAADADLIAHAPADLAALVAVAEAAERNHGLCPDSCDLCIALAALEDS